MTEDRSGGSDVASRETPQEPLGVQPPARGLPGCPSRGCLMFGLGLGILGFLFLMSAPCFFEAQTRAKVVRAGSDMRSLATALEAYEADEKAYPPSAPWIAADNASADNASAGSASTGKAGRKAPAKRKDDADAITTFAVRPDGSEYLRAPKPYIDSSSSSLSAQPVDIFSVEPRTHFGYYTTGHSWVLFSAGPDRVYDLTDPSRLPTKPDGSLDPEQFVEMTYDPSNGTDSRGDVFRFSGGAGR